MCVCLFVVLFRPSTFLRQKETQNAIIRGSLNTEETVIKYMMELLYERTSEETLINAKKVAGRILAAEAKPRNTLSFNTPKLWNILGVVTESCAKQVPQFN